MTSRRYLDQRLRLQLLRLVDAVEQQRSLLKASAVLGVSQPALTKSIHELENILQLRLFDRHSRGMNPTEAGLRFARAARRILADLRRLDEELDDLASANFGLVKVGALPVAASGVLPGALTRLKLANPGIRIHLEQGSTEQLLPHLAAGEIDLIVGRLYEPAMPDGFVREPYWYEPLSVFARVDHPIFSAPRITVETLRDYELILPSLSQKVGQEIDQLVMRCGLGSEAALQSSSYDFIREMLHATDMISIMPCLMMVGDLMRGTLGVAPLPIPAPERPAGLILAGSRSLNPAVQTFIEHLSDYVGDIVRQGIAPITSSNTTPEKHDKTRNIKLYNALN